MINQQYKFLLKCICLLLVIVLGLSLYTINKNQNTIRIGAKNFTEQQVLAYALEDIIENQTDYEVDVVTGIDTTSILNNALLRQDLDLYIEYSSVAYIEIYQHLYDGESNAEIVDTIKQDYANDGLTWLVDLGFENSNAIICNQYCQEHDIDNLSDLESDAQFSFGAPIYFFKRSDGFNLLVDKYGYNNYQQVNLDSNLVYPALSSGEVDLGLAFTTDAKLATGDYQIINDDQNAFSAYEAGIVVNDQSLDQFPGLEEILLQLNSYFTTEKIQEYNNMVENDGLSSQQVGELIADQFIKNIVQKEN